MQTTETNIPLPVMEQFYTVQGEGYHQGKAAYFIRLGGCDVGCVWCDVKDSWDATAHPLQTVSQLTQAVLATKAKLVVITGGEPTLHSLETLTHSLRENNLLCHLETSGTQPISGCWDWICLSPKKFKPALPQSYLLAQELKVVIYHPSDLEWAAQQAKMVNATCKLYLQPEWTKIETMIPMIVDYIKDNPHWELSLQLHNYIHVP